MLTKWLLDRSNGSKNDPGMPPRRAFGGFLKHLVFEGVAQHPHGLPEPLVLPLRRLRPPEFILLHFIALEPSCERYKSL
jgi:hypothetical protein